MSGLNTWMPLYVGDYLADTMHLTTIEHGAYMLLLMHYWRTGPLVDDDVSLARITKTEVAWPSIAGTVRGFFKPRKGLLYHKRVDVEKERLVRLSEKRAKSGQKGGLSKARKGKQNQEAASNTSFLPAFCQVQSQSQSHRSKKERKATPYDAPAVASLPDARSELWSDGVAKVRALTGLSEARARGLVGRLLKTARENCAHLNAALTEAVDLRPIDPVAWLQRAVESHATPRKSTFDRIREDMQLPNVLLDLLPKEMLPQ